MKTLSKLIAVVLCFTVCSCYVETGITSGYYDTTYYRTAPSRVCYPITPTYTYKCYTSRVHRPTTYYRPYYGSRCNTNTFIYYKK